MSDEKDTANTETKENQEGGDAKEKSFAERLPEDLRAEYAAIEESTGALSRAHERTKETLKTLKNDFKTLKGSKDTDIQKAVEDIEAKLAKSESDAAFYKSVPSDVLDREKAKILAEAQGLIRSDGALDVDKFREKNPEQFQTESDTKGYGGRGTRTVVKDNKPAHQVINDALFAAG
jgi:hypothetical protein